MKGIDVAKTKLGLHEDRNTKDLDSFIKNALPIWKPYHVNNTPWCAAFVNACEKTVGNGGTNSLMARSFIFYGTIIYDKNKKIGSITDAFPGDIVIFDRGNNAWQGHVAYFDGFEENSEGLILVRTVGGNQSNSVSKGWYPIERLISIRRP